MIFVSFHEICRFFVVLLATVVVSIPVASADTAGSSLFSQARSLNNNNDDAYDFSWVTDYSIQFHSCHTTLSFRADGASGSGDGDGDEEPTELERTVLYQLCPTNAKSQNMCSSKCKGGGEYLVELREFVEAVYESKMSTQEYNCEKVEENCDCDNYNDDDVCLSACYATAGLDYCEDDDEDNDDDFDLEEYLECREVEGYNDDDSNANRIYVGAYCASSGSDIRLGVFTDRQCSKQVANSVYSTLTGYSLYSNSLVEGSCISCKEPSEYDDDYNADQYDADEVTEICEELYDRSAKCEKNINIEERSVGGCNYIHNLLPQLEKVVVSNSAESASTVLAWLFFLSTVGVTALAFLFYKKAQRSDVHLLKGSLL